MGDQVRLTGLVGLGGNPNPGLRGISPNVPSLRSLRRNCDDLFLVWPFAAAKFAFEFAFAFAFVAVTVLAVYDVEGGDRDGLLLKLRVIPDDRFCLLVLVVYLSLPPGYDCGGTVSPFGHRSLAKASQSADVRPTKIDDVHLDELRRDGRDSDCLEEPVLEGVLVDFLPPTASDMRDTQLHLAIFLAEAASSSAGFPRVPRGGAPSTSTIVSVTADTLPLLPLPASMSSRCFS